MTTERRVRRRDFLKLSCAGAAALLPARAAALQPPVPGARLLGTVPLESSTPRPKPPLGLLLGERLDARLFADLSTIARERPTMSTEQFFVRTAAPELLDPDRWRLSLGAGGRDLAVDLATLDALTADQGQCLLECAGNTDPTNFGLLSTAEWQGVPISTVLDLGPSARGSQRVLVTGIDPLGPSRTSVPGASWIFSRDDLVSARAFLATRMNDASLPRHHGAPLRLIVPGWYGCACIKWVSRIDLVDDGATATPQMNEFAARTHQEGAPALARDYAPAVVDLAAMPVRVEKWRLPSGLVYRIVGIMWGGSKPTSALQIRFHAGSGFVPVNDCPLPTTTRTLTVWTHVWRPPAAQRYDIVLRCGDPSIRTRRLDLYFYTRSVTIDDVA